VSVNQKIGRNLTFGSSKILEQEKLLQAKLSRHMAVSKKNFEKRKFETTQFKDMRESIRTCIYHIFFTQRKGGA